MSRHPIIAAGLLAGALMAAACQPPAPQPGTTDLVGDSLTVQTLHDGQIPGMDGVVWHAWLGWTAADVQPWVTDQAHVHARPETLVVALGSNDAALRNGGWTWADIKAWADLLDTPHPDACVAVVLPAVGDAADAAYAAEIDRARDSITAIVGARTGPTVIEDWGIVIDADPGVLHTDGLHLARRPDDGATDPYAAAARVATYQRAADRCEDL